jgi:hypothetical protein
LSSCRTSNVVERGAEIAEPAEIATNMAAKIERMLTWFFMGFAW